ncbi:uncharacterized protein VNE69_03140 [Vairimorpha necatrix]|uniref:Uncharacterized protein n=1 Tax=Vairimorpha necatrix TaxID=6039 RepID=A0AAX4JAH7_9MICR
MLTHPYVLDLLKTWKLSEDQNIPKDLLVLLCHKNTNMPLENLYNTLYKYKNNRKRREMNIRKLTNALREWYDLEKGIFRLKDMKDLSDETKKLIGKRSEYRNEDITKMFEKINLKEEEKNKNKIKQDIKEEQTNKNKKKDELPIRKKEEEIKVNKKKKKVKMTEVKSNDSSILNYITKREKLVSQSSRFIPLQFNSTVYIYNLKNPNKISLRRRKDLINPVKKIFIKLAADCRPPIYKKQDKNIKIRNSLGNILGVDYDEDSTWEEEDDGEDIVSEENETDDEDSSESEWVENDTEVDIQRTEKKPHLSFPIIKIEINEEFNEEWNKLPLRKTNEI